MVIMFRGKCPSIELTFFQFTFGFRFRISIFLTSITVFFIFHGSNIIFSVSITKELTEQVLGPSDAMNELGRSISNSTSGKSLCWRVFNTIITFSFTALNSTTLTKITSCSSINEWGASSDTDTVDMTSGSWKKLNFKYKKRRKLMTTLKNLENSTKNIVKTPSCSCVRLSRQFYNFFLIFLVFLVTNFCSS